MKLFPSISSLRAAAAAVIALLAGAVIYSCNTSGCTDNQSALPLAGFYSSSTKSAITLRDLTITGEGAPGDSALYGANESLSEVYLPFRSTQTSTAYLFSYQLDSVTTVTDRIAFTYSSEPYFASEECGAMYYYRINSLSYTTNIIDSVTIVDSLVTNTNLQRLHIYFRTSDNPQQ